MKAIREQKSDYVCKTCSFSIWLPIEKLRVSYLGLYDDARFPGRCILSLTEHFEDLTELPQELAETFMADIQLSGRAIAGAVSANRMNYAILGNREPHLHVHLIPRVGLSDPIPSRTPWEHPNERSPLASSDIKKLMSAIRQSLKAIGQP